MTELRNAGCRVIAVCKPDSNVHRFLLARGVECRTLPNNRKISAASIRFVRNLVEHEYVDVVHVHFHKDIWIPSIALRRDHRRKLFLSIYMGVISKNDLLHRWIYGRVDGIFTSSEELNARLPALYPVPKEKVHLLPYGRSLETYRISQTRRDEIRAKLLVKPDGLLVGTMVRIDPGKGALDFARSILYLDRETARDINYVIVGEPTRKSVRRPGESPYERHCEEYLKHIEAFIHEHQLSDRLALAGFQEDLIGYLGAMDIFVFPSRDELYSLVVLDAMCMNLPVVAARAGGNLRQIRDGQNGLLYNVGDSKDLAEKVLQYAGDRELRRQHAAAGRAFVEERHSMSGAIRRLLSFYGSSKDMNRSFE